MCRAGKVILLDNGIGHNRTEIPANQKEAIQERDLTVLYQKIWMWGKQFFKI